MIDLISRERKTCVGAEQIAQAIDLLQNAEMLVGHNIKSFDIRIIEKIMEGTVTFDRDKVIDTLHLSKALTKMDNHKLDGWGEILGLEKLSTPFSFYRFDRRMIPYCERDVDLNLKVFLALWSLMEARHGEKIPSKWQKLNEYREELSKPAV